MTIRLGNGQEPAVRKTAAQYAVGIICALDFEFALMQAMLDAHHDPPDLPVGDDNSYRFGAIGNHDIVLACLPDGMFGKASAAVTANNMKHSFRIQFALLVGIGGGVWSSCIDLRLGDVVVSSPTDSHGGLVQWDFGRVEGEGVFRRKGTLNRPPSILLNAVKALRAQHKLQGHRLAKYLSEAADHYPLIASSTRRPDRTDDRLFLPTYEHPGGDNCELCDSSMLVAREPRNNDLEPEIFYGNIASGDEVVMHGLTRNIIAERESIICFEMEAAGIDAAFPCLVIRGISDYADSHKSYKWQHYAASVAAAYAKELLLSVASRIPASRQASLQGSGSVDNYTDGDSFAILDSPMSSVGLKRAATFGRPAGMGSDKALGDISNESHHRSRSIDDFAKRLLRSLRYKRMTLHRSELSDGVAGTCQWIFQHNDYNSWSKDGGLLWLCGKPGAGKSTMMKRLLNSMPTNAGTDDSTTLLSHFFYGRGGGMQSKVVGLYRSLLYQLLSRHDLLLSKFSKRCEDAGILDEEEEVDWEDHPTFLKEALSTLLIDCLDTVTLYILVDALDECADLDDARHLAQMLEQIPGRAQERHCRLSICVSARLSPTTIQNAKYKINMSDHSANDVQTVIRHWLKSINLPQKESIETLIQDRASGTFQWVNLVIKQIIDDQSKGKTSSAILNNIVTTPKALDDLYDGLLRDIDDEQAIIAVRLFRIICYSFDPITSEDLRLAMSLAPDCKTGSSIDEVIRLNHGCRDAAEMEMVAISLSKGLLEVKPQGQARVVQFIHQSAKDFIQQRGIALLKEKVKVDFDVVKDPALAATYQLAAIVHRRLQLHDFTQRQWVTTEGKWTEAKLARYAIRNFLRLTDSVLGHAECTKQLARDIWLPSDDNFVAMLKGSHAISGGFTFQAFTLWQATVTWGFPSIVREIWSRHGSRELLHTGFSKLYPIHAAVIPNDTRCLEFLLEQGIDVDTLSDFNTTPLMEAAGLGKVQATNLLLDRGAKINLTVSAQPAHGTALMTAALSGHLETCRILLSRGADVNACMTQIWVYGPLNLAALKKHLNIVQLLLDSGADVHMGEGGSSALAYAAHSGSLPIVNLLLDRSAKIDDTAEGEWTILSNAMLQNQFEAAELLIKRGANPNFASQDGETPLMVAARMNALGPIRLLLENGADLHVTSTASDRTHHNAFTSAVAFGQIEVLRELLLRGADANEKFKDGRHSLHVATNRSLPGVVELLLDHGADISAVDNHGRSALQWAAYNGHVQTMRVLVDRGAEINHIAHNQLTSALSDAAWAGHAEAMQFLVDHGADVSVRNSYGSSLVALASLSGNAAAVRAAVSLIPDALNAPYNTGDGPMHIAATNGNLSAIETLVDLGAPVDIRNTPEATPLHIAAKNGKREVVSWLIQHGADVNSRDSKLDTSLHAAAENGHAEVVELLLEKGADLDALDKSHWTPLFEATKAGHLAIVEMLVSKGASLCGVSTNSHTVLTLPCSGGHLGVVQCLLKAGADPDFSGPDGRTPMYSAACNDHVEVIKSLVGAGADVNKVDADGFSPLHTASFQGHLAAVKVLVENGAMIAYGASGGQTALTFAIKAGSSEICTYLLTQGAELESSISCISDDGWTKAFGHDSADVIDVLIRHGMAADRASSDEWSLFSLAAYAGATNVVNKLLEEGADIVAGQSWNHIPLARALQAGKHEVVTRLVQVMVGRQMASTYHADALREAVKSNNSEMVAALLCEDHTGYHPSLLSVYAWESQWNDDFQSALDTVLEAGAQVSNADQGWVGPLKTASVSGKALTFNKIFKKWAGGEYCDPYGSHLTHLALQVGDLDSLASMDTNPVFSHRDVLGKSALHYAASHFHSDEPLEWVLERAPNLDLNARDGYGWSALHWAAHTGCPNSLSKLCELGAEVLIQDKRGWTALDVAINNGREEGIIGLLKNKSKDGGVTACVTGAGKEFELLCNSCACHIHGECYSCEQCNGFDICFRCFDVIKELHFPHTFARMHEELDEATDVVSSAKAKMENKRIHRTLARLGPITRLPRAERNPDEGVRLLSIRGRIPTSDLD